ncbi:MAG: alanine--tRNA ligase [Planctomycetota bacterium]
MKTDEIRRRFLDFFREREHRIVPPDTLVPQNDPSLLFTGAGMNQFKDEFYGRGDADMNRAATCQKCLRTGDIENVGKTASHHTYFEMLGNFSFGDYFKDKAIPWAWQFMRQEMGIPAERMVVSIYEEDEEAYRIWTESVGVSEDSIFRFGEGENFWPANVRSQGPNGPCGPCSEIFYDMGQDTGCGRTGCDPSCECDRYVEVWNLVFQQYDRKEGGKLDPLPLKNIDTGMGLERMARVMQGVPTNYDIDAFAPIINKISEICGQDYSPDSDNAPLIRRIADHARAVFFCVADGVIPSNEERGYVVRRLLRRAVRDAFLLGVEEPFMTELIDPVIAVSTDPYPELEESRSHIETVVTQEEKSFQKTVSRGSAVLDEHIASLKRQKASTLRGKEIFDLYQTYGFPVEMTESILHEHGISADVQGFLQHLEAHQQQSKDAASFEDGVFVEGPISRLQGDYEPTEFTGYHTLESEGEIIGIISGDELVEEAGEEDTVGVVLDRTPAYGEAGGQLGDTGEVETVDGQDGILEFDSVRREKGFFIHQGRVSSGCLKMGDRVVCRVDREHREATARNHTATHLLHYALREVLGEHATQSGSAVSDTRLRFDFSNPTELSPDEIHEVEDIVNEKILADEPVVTTRMSRSEAREMGAMALFGEKYGDIVRVVTIGGFSRELCGGTHCERTGEVGLFRITGESSVAGGVRRIEAVTGLNSLRRLREKEKLITQLCDSMSTQEDNLLERSNDLQKQIRSLENDLQKAREEAMRKMASGGGLMDEAEEIEGMRAIFTTLDGGHSELRSALDVIKDKHDNVVCVLASVEEGKVALVTGVTDDLVDRGLDAEQIATAAAQTLGGGGGGRPDLAQAGGSDPERLEEAFDAARDVVKKAAQQT